MTCSNKISRSSTIRLISAKFFDICRSKSTAEAEASLECLAYEELSRVVILSKARFHFSSPSSMCLFTIPFTSSIISAFQIDSEAVMKIRYVELLPLIRREKFASLKLLKLHFCLLWSELLHSIELNLRPVNATSR